MCVFAGIGNWKVWRMLSQNIWIDHSKTLTFIFSASPQFPSIFCTFFRSIFAVLFSRFLFDISHYPYNSIICKKTYAKLRGKKSCFVIDHSVDFPTGIQNFHPKWQREKEEEKQLFVHSLNEIICGLWHTNICIWIHSSGYAKWKQVSEEEERTREQEEEEEERKATKKYEYVS